VPPLKRHIAPRHRGSEPLTHTPIALYISRKRQQNMKQPVLKFGLVCGLSLETTSHDDSVHYPTETQQPPEPAAGAIPCQGALRTPASSSTAPKWTMVGVANASPACAAPFPMGMSAMRVMTTNCKPISAPADEPTIT